MDVRLPVPVIAMAFSDGAAVISPLNIGQRSSELMVNASALCQKPTLEDLEGRRSLKGFCFTASRLGMTGRLRAPATGDIVQPKSPREWSN